MARTREEQVDEVTFALKKPVCRPDYSPEILRMWVESIIEEAEQRGYERARAELERGNECCAVAVWRRDETNGPPTFVSWNDAPFNQPYGKEVRLYSHPSATAEDTKRLDYLLSISHYGIPGFDPKVHGRSPEERRADLIRAIDAAMKGAENV